MTSETATAERINITGVMTKLGQYLLELLALFVCKISRRMQQYLNHPEAVSPEYDTFRQCVFSSREVKVLRLSVGSEGEYVFSQEEGL